MQNSQSATASFNNPLIKFISAPRYRWLRHLLFILLGLILAFKGDIPGRFSSPELQKAVLATDAASYLFIMGMIYLLLLVLIPKLLFRSRMLLFGIFFFIIIFLIYVCVWLLDYYFIAPIDHSNNQRIEFSLIHFIQIGAVCAVLLSSVVGLKVFKKWIGDIRQMNELQQANLKTELQQLKSQVNPHFLFNTLNNLLVLVKTDPDKASQVLLGLSDLLRYQLYDSTKEKILLSKDIEFIHNLLSLEQIRKNDFEYHIHTEGPIDGQLLPPFLFIPFVENAIKHGASTVGHSYLTIHFRITGQQLHFTAENSKPAVKKTMAGGLGLVNLQRRLALLYPGRHTLDITDKADKYIVHLILPL
jgi:sensor histidine kinase YesM